MDKTSKGKDATTPAGQPVAAKLESSLTADAGANEVDITLAISGVEFAATLPRKAAKAFANDILAAAKASKR